MISTRIFNKFSIQKSKDINSTIKFLNSFHNTIIASENAKLNRMDDESPLYFHCTYADFTSTLKKSDVATTGTTFCNILRNLRGFGKETVEKITSRFKTFREAYIFMNSASRDLQEISLFLNILNKDQKPIFIKSMVTVNPSEIYALI